MLSDLVEAFVAELGRPDVQVLVGGKNLAANDQPPRIVIVPTSDSFVPPAHVGGTPRALYGRQVGFVLHLWGASFEDTEALLLDAVVALRRAVSGPALSLGGADWIGQDGELMKHGDACELTCSVTLPVYDQTPMTTTIKSVEAICSDA